MPKMVPCPVHPVGPCSSFARRLPARVWTRAGATRLVACLLLS